MRCRAGRIITQWEQSHSEEPDEHDNPCSNISSVCVAVNDAVRVMQPRLPF